MNPLVLDSKLQPSSDPFFPVCACPTSASDQVHAGDESVSAAHTELQEAEEALRQAQIRVQNVRIPFLAIFFSIFIDVMFREKVLCHCHPFGRVGPFCLKLPCSSLQLSHYHVDFYFPPIVQAKESFSTALSELAERKLKKSATDTKLEAGSLICKWNSPVIHGLLDSCSSSTVPVGRSYAHLPARHSFPPGMFSQNNESCSYLNYPLDSDGGQAGGQGPPQRARHRADQRGGAQKGATHLLPLCSRCLVSGRPLALGQTLSSNKSICTPLCLSVSPAE